MNKFIPFSPLFTPLYVRSVDADARSVELCELLTGDLITVISRPDLSAVAGRAVVVILVGGKATTGAKEFVTDGTLPEIHTQPGICNTRSHISGTKSVCNQLLCIANRLLG